MSISHTKHAVLIDQALIAVRKCEDVTSVDLTHETCSTGADCRYKQCGVGAIVSIYVTKHALLIYQTQVAVRQCKDVTSVHLTHETCSADRPDTDSR